MSAGESEYYRNGVKVEHVGTIADLSRLLGVSSQYLYKLRDSGDFDVDPVAKIGKSLVYRYDEAEAWLKRRRMASTRRRLNTTYRGYV